MSESNVLYISYDGMMEPLGQSQVLAYLKCLAPGRRIHLVSFEKTEDWANKTEREQISREILGSGIVWHPLRYHKRLALLATAWDVLRGITLCSWLAVRHRLRLVHARSYVPAVIALALKRIMNVKVLFDMRGFWADERADVGQWPRSGRRYRAAKWFERQFLLNADHVISLTFAAVREMEQFTYLKNRQPPVTVIPTCTDLKRFCPQEGERHGFVMGYLGTAGRWYEFDAVVACFVELLKQRPEARFLILNRNEHDYILERLQAGGVPTESVELRSVSYAEAAQQMARIHAGVFFIKPLFSTQASAPTKLGEFLGCGIPCLSNSGIGDMAEILESEKVGVALNDSTPDSLRAGLARLLTLVDQIGIEERCVAAAQKHFSLEEGAKRYAEVYEKLAMA